jgi:hypothetical protein
MAHPKYRCGSTLAVYVDFELAGIQYTAALLVASTPIAAGESVRVWYGDAYAPHRTWDAAAPSRRPNITEDALVDFLTQHCRLDLEDITHLCLARYGDQSDAYHTCPALPKVQPATVLVE